MIEAGPIPVWCRAMRRAVATAAAVLVGLGMTGTGACSSGGGNGTPTTLATTAAPAQTTTSAAPGLTGAGLTQVSTPDQGHTKLTALRAENAGGFDRLTFEFTGGLPGYVVEYTT